jgi:hypothetical protein
MGKEATDTRSSSVKTGWPQHFNYARKQNVDNSRLGSGERFAKLRDKLAAEPGVTNPDALAASIGRKKYGKAKFQSLAAKGTPGY